VSSSSSVTLSDERTQTPAILSVAAADVSGIDLTIASVVAPTSSDEHWSFDIEIAEPTDYERDNLSFMLELSQQQDFSTVYRTALFDQVITGNRISARTKTPALPSSNYFARVQVNPDWGMYLENQFEDSNLSVPLRYIEESDYNNNHSEVFMLQIVSTITCTEDAYETDTGISDAPVLTQGSSVSASLCLDNADYYAFELAQGTNTILTIKQPDNPVAARYAIVDPDYNVSETGVIFGAAKDIQVTAQQSGTHHLAIYGNRTNYQLSRDITATLNHDWFFTTDSVDGPVSPLLGPITLNRLQFTRDGLIGQSVQCARYIIDPDSGDRYITPPHFPDIHTYRFQDNNVYFIDEERHLDWMVSGDISTANWYENLYYGWAENIGNGGWRYWDFEGDSYVECEIL